MYRRASVADAAETRKVESSGRTFPTSGTNAPPPSVLVSDMEAEIKRLREQVAELEGSATRASSRASTNSGVAGGLFIPVMPGSILAELCQWIEDRQTDLQEALVDGNTSTRIDVKGGGKGQNN